MLSGEQFADCLAWQKLADSSAVLCDDQAAQGHRSLGDRKVLLHQFEKKGPSSHVRRGPSGFCGEPELSVPASALWLGQAASFSG
jgi:hypothetical protein